MLPLLSTFKEIPFDFGGFQVLRDTLTQISGALSTQSFTHISINIRIILYIKVCITKYTICLLKSRKS